MPDVIYSIDEHIKNEFNIQNIEINIPLNRGNKIELPYYGVVFAEDIIFKDDSVKHESYWKVDNGVFWEDTLAYKLIELSKENNGEVGKFIPIKTKNKIPFDDKYVDKNGDEKEIKLKTQYSLVYQNKDSLYFKPTIQLSISDAMNVESVATLEFLFAFEDDYFLPVYKTYSTGGSNSLNFIDMLKDSLYDLSDLRDFEDFFGDCGNVKFNREEEIVEIDVCDIYGNFATLEFSNNRSGMVEISRALCSIRLVELEETIKSRENQIVIKH